MYKVKTIMLSFIVLVSLLACEEEVKNTKVMHNSYIETLSIRYNREKENIFQLRKEVSEEPRSSFSDGVKSKEEKAAIELSRKGYKLKKGIIIRSLQSLEKEIEKQKMLATEKEDQETLDKLISLKREVSNLLKEIQPKRPAIK